MGKQLEGPEFIGVGVQRGGTSWLYECLKEHPQTYIPTKEVHFFDEKYDLGSDWYRQLFTQPDAELVPGEYTPDYIASKVTIERIYKFNPNVKLILILREPLSRAHSAYKLYQSYGRFKDLDFNAAVEKDPWIIKQSLYSEQIGHLFSLFPKSNVHIDFYEKIEENPRQFFKDVCEFIGIDGEYDPDALYSVRNTSINATLQDGFGLIKLQNFLLRKGFSRQINWMKNMKLFGFMKRALIQRSKQKSSEIKVDPKVVAMIEQDVEKLEKILSLSLSNWKANY
ncbi:sulfotransferase [Marinobacter sp. MMG032]|uniref:Sulfotransferase n=1 Tax=Marinobacter sp. MMG032 TaxID=3158548 RepID=A0AAU7MMN1_9GAMM